MLRHLKRYNEVKLALDEERLREVAAGTCRRGFQLALSPNLRRFQKCFKPGFAEN